MQADFWHKAWAKSERPGWQQKKVNPNLKAHWPQGNGSGSDVVFVPLCGRSLDMQWLHEQGHPVIGIDLSVAAIERFCEQQSIAASCERDGGLTVYRAPGWTLYAGDFFKLTADHLVRVGRVYDRAALIALPPATRKLYAEHLRSILPVSAEIFLITICYDQSIMQGPPFSVADSEVEELFSSYSRRVLQQDNGPHMTGNLQQRGVDTLTETCGLLQPASDT